MSDAVPADDRAFLYGDGLFETLLAADGHLLWPELHFQRLEEGGKRLSISCDLTELREALAAYAKGTAPGYAVIRLTLSRGSGPRGYLPVLGTGSRFRITHKLLARDPFLPEQALHLAPSSVVLPRQPLLAGIKHCNRLEQVLAALDAKERGVDDVLLCNDSGRLQCTSRGNLFIVRDAMLYTPGCGHCGIVGTRRQLVMQQLAPMLNLGVAEADFFLHELRATDAMFVTNTVMGIRRVGRIDAQTLPDCAAITELQRAYTAAAKTCLAA